MSETGPERVGGLAVVLMSGGIDSMACAHFLRSQSFDVRGLFVDYGQVAKSAELLAVRAVADSLGVSLMTTALAFQRQFGAGEIQGRNGLLAMIALTMCPSGTRIIGMGIHAGTPYYDCSPAFAERIDTLMQEYTSGAIRYLAPFLNWTKQDVYQYCRREGLNLSLTYSCETGTTPACGHCLSCLDRQLLDAR